MKFSRRSLARSARASRRRIRGSGDHALVESKCPACGQILDSMMAPLLEQRAGTSVTSPNPAEGIRGIGGRPSHAMNTEQLLHFSQQLYAHALTLQEVIRNGGGLTYEVLRPRCERQAAQQFEVFYHNFGQPSGCFYGSFE